MSQQVRPGSGADLDARAVDNFRAYLQIPSVHPDVDYAPVGEWLKQQAASLGLPLRVEAPSKPSKPVFIITWAGSEPQLPALMLNSHTDVVPVYPEHWTHDPFAAHKDSEGNIYARGAQDMKSVGVQHIEAVRRLREQGFRPRRTVHLTFSPDEEIGSEDGMRSFVNTEAFSSLNVGFALDESAPSPGKELIVFYAERSIWQVEFVITGTPGHGSIALENTAGEKVRRLLDRLMDYRAQEIARIKDVLRMGETTTINITMLKGGVQNNVVPPEMSVVVDIRVAPDVDHEAFLDMLNSWCAYAGPGVTMNFQQKGEREGVSKIDASNPWWSAFKKACDGMQVQLRTAVCAGGTDARFLRRLGIPALGFSPMYNTPMLLHANDEFINESVFLRGVAVFTEVVRALASL